MQNTVGKFIVVSHLVALFLKYLFDSEEEKDAISMESPVMI